MASLVLGAVGTAIGGNIGGAILGMSGAAIGGAIGTALGSAVDSWLIARLSPQQRIEGARLDSLRITSSTEGAVVPRVFGRMRLGGNIIWATDFRETVTRRRERVSKFQKVSITEYDYSASFAVGLCEGPVAGIGRIWADGEPMDLEGVSWRWYPGDEDQEPDPVIVAAMGADAAPAYRGTAYVVFEDLELEAYGNRIPQLSFEVIRPLAEPDAMEGSLRAVTLIPGSGEFAYAAGAVRGDSQGGIFGGDSFTPSPDASGGGAPENQNARDGVPDLVVALDQLQAAGPAVGSVSLVVSGFGDDLRAGDCTIRPKVERADKITVPPWSVNGLDRAAAQVVSQLDGEPVYGGTPADITIVEAIQEMKERGLRVTFYPFIMMDVPSGNTLPNPYSDNAADSGQPALPWRGRITCSPAPGFAGTVDKTATAADQVAAFFGTALPSQFAVTDTSVTWTGGADWGLRRMVLHYAHLCRAAGGVDAFLIGTEMRGLTTIRSGVSDYPAVAAFRQLAADVRAILGPDTRISYAADWSEYFGHQPGDGSGDVHFHLDPLWSDPDIDFIGIDNYMPVSDWRDGFEHLDAQAGWPAIHDRAYLQANIAGGEGFDWFYGSEAARADQDRTPILDSYPVTRDIAIPREIEGPALIGPTGLMTNSWHQVLGRDGYFHPDSGTSEGQFVMIYACARAAKVLAATDPEAAQSYSDRSRLMASTLEETFYRRPFTSDTNQLFVPHWLNAARDGFELQSVDLGYPVTFQPIGGGLLSATIPAGAGGDVLLTVHSVRAADAILLWDNAFSPVVGTAYALAADPVVTGAGAEIRIAGTASVQALVCFSYNRGDILPAGQPYEAWPIWRRLEAGEIACAGDAMRWAILAYDAMDTLHGGTRWATASAVTRANTIRAFAVDDGRWIMKPGRGLDPYATAGLFTFDTRPTLWTRDAGGGFRASLSGSGESQIGRGVEVPVAAGETLTIRIGATLATGEVQVFLDSAAGYSATTRWIADLTLAGTGVQEIILPLSSFLRLSDNAPLSGPLTIHAAGVIDREAAPHVTILESLRPTQSNDPDYAPFIVPFTINVLRGDIIDWRGVPGSGYQAPDLWPEIGGPDAAAGMLAHAEFLRNAQDAWETDQSWRGPFAHAYVWDRFDAEDFGQPPGTWIYDWHDPNSRWGGYQYRPLDAAARAIAKTEGQPAFDAARALCIDVVADFLAWLNGHWTSAASGPPTDFRPDAIDTDYDEPHFAAIILRTCLYALRSAEYRADPTREATALTLAARAWDYMETRWTAEGDLAGTWSGGWPEWFGFWHAEIIDTLAELMEDDAALAVELGIPVADVRERLVLSDQFLEAASASTLGQESGESWLFRYKDMRNWWARHHHDRPGGVRNEDPTGWEPQSKPIWFTEFGCPAVDRGTNQPNVFFDPKSSESFVPYFSRGWRDDAIQRSYHEATAAFWTEPLNNPVSAVYGAPMVHWPECAAWTWDARPYPAFPTLEDLWIDGTNWRLGHWLTGRLGSASLPALVRVLCRRAGLPDARIDVTGIWGAIEGFAIASIESPRASIATLGRAFGFDAVETEGRIRFVMRGRAPVARVVLDAAGADPAFPPQPHALRTAEAVRSGDGAGELYEMTRAQESELPATLRWTVSRADDDRYESAVVEAARATATHARLAAESFPFALPPEEAERLCRRALAEAWTGREALSVRLPPSALALDPGDVIRAETGLHRLDFRVLALADAEARTVEAVRQDREDRDGAPGSARLARINRPLNLGAPDVAILDLPLIFEGREEHQPLIAAQARPWPGTMAVFRSADGASGWGLLTSFSWRARSGRLTEALPAGRPGLYQRGPGAVVELDSGTLESVARLEMLGGANLIAIEAEDGWELIQAEHAELIAPRTWRLTQLLRGQRGTEWAIRDPAPAGARVVVIDPELASLPVLLGEIGLPQALRVGPANRPLTDATYAAGTLTPQAVGLRPFAPVHLRARFEGDDVLLTWIRRDRTLAADSWTFAEIPMTEATEAYEVEIIDGSGVLRTLSTGAPSALYTAAQQVADFGAALAPGDPLTFRVRQISNLLGPGFPAQRTVNL